MAQDVEAQQDKPSNACCAKLQKKHSKLLERCAKLEQIKNKFRDCTLAMQQRCDVVERDRKSLRRDNESLRRDNESLREASEKLKVQVNLWNSEKDIEAGRRADLEVQLLKQNSGSASRRGDEQLRERIAQAEEEIKLLKELLDRERGKVASEKKRTELEKKKAVEALKKLESVERKKAEEYKLLWEKLQKENDDMKPMLSLEKSRSRDAEKQKAIIGRQRVELTVAKPEEQIFVPDTSLENDRADDLNRKLEQARKRVEQLEGELLKHKCSEESKDRLLLEMLKKETDDLKSLLALEKSKSEAAHKKLEAEKQKTIRERKRADSAVAQKRITEKCLEKDQADDLNRKLEQARNRVEQLEDELLKHKCCEKSEDRLLLEKSKKETDDLKSMLALEKSKPEDAHKKLEAEKQKTIGQSKRAKLAVEKSKEQINLAETNLKKAMYEKARADDLSRKLEEAKNRADKSSPSRNAVTATDIRTEMLKNDTHFHKWVEKMLLEKEHDIVREKKRADSAKKKAKKQIKVAEEYKKMSMEQKDRADQLSGQLETYKLRLEGLQKEMQAFVSSRIYAGTSPMINNDVIYETDTVELLKKQLKLEKLLAKHAKEATKIEALRNTMLRQELCHLKKESVQFQQHMNILLDKSFLHGPEGIDQLKKIGSETTKRKVLGSDGSRRRVMSGIHSRMDPPYRGSSQKMLQSSAIYSSSASFSDWPLVGSQERDTFSIMTSANLGEDISNFKPKIPNKMQNDQNVAKPDNRTSSPIKDSSSKRRLGLRQKKRNLGAVESIENLHAKGEKLHQHVSEKLAILHDTLNGQVDDSQEESLKGTTCTELFRPLKKRKSSSEGTVIVDHLQNSGESKGTVSSDINNSDSCVPASSPGSDAVISDLGDEDGTNNILEHNMSTSPDFDQIVTGDHMKLLDMDNAADEDWLRLK
ncbi:apical junction molecule-like [Salvia splendens]|uniref:apical junction molecule-like n=1 Tax=Salvia splendens TaxID=180675 RepID=UPI001C262408|nr:apical junction molecule-like [Salvia splendens]